MNLFRFDPPLGHHAVLPADTPVVLRGHDLPGSEVRICGAGWDAAGIANSDGRWQIDLPPGPAGGPFELNLEGSRAGQLHDICRGEVWICSGQSNMHWPIAKSDHAEAECANADCPDLRLLSIPISVAAEPASSLDSAWSRCSPKTVRNFSAVAYHFGRRLQDELGVPVGLIHASWGNTPVMAWMSRRALESGSGFASILEEYQRICDADPEAAADLPGAFRRWQEAMQQHAPAAQEWMRQAVAAKAAGLPIPTPPERPTGPATNFSPTLAFNAMIGPLAGCRPRGILWYQGETDAIQNRAALYSDLLQAMVGDWRSWLDREDAYFIQVQLANFDDPQCADADTQWAELRAAQMHADGQIPDSTLISAIDLGDPAEIHFTNKKPVGERAATAALAEVYGRGLPYAGPHLREVQRNGDHLDLFFDGDDLQLANGDTPHHGLELQTADERWTPVTGQLSGSRHLRVPLETHHGKATAIRYAWSANPPCSIRDRQGLPAFPFFRAV